MDAAIVIALIALAGSVLSTVATVFGAPAFQARREAREVLKQYEEPLLQAAYELQSRLYNIVNGKVLESYPKGGKAGKQDPVDSTLYAFAQYFGWRELIRRDIRFLSFAQDRKTRKVNELLDSIEETFLDDKDEYGHQFMIWRLEQRGLGERMIISAGSGRTCMGYATFLDRRRTTMGRWLEPLEDDLSHIEDEGKNRVRELQHLLLRLVRVLDPKHRRYRANLKEA